MGLEIEPGTTISRVAVVGEDLIVTITLEHGAVELLERLETVLREGEAAGAPRERSTTLVDAFARWCLCNRASDRPDAARGVLGRHVRRDRCPDLGLSPPHRPKGDDR
jgi:hypothetical protein